MSSKAKYEKITLLVRFPGTYSVEQVIFGIRDAIKDRAPDVIIGASWSEPAFDLSLSKSRKKGGTQAT